MSDFIFFRDKKFQTVVAVTEQEQQKGLMFQKPPTPIMTFPAKQASIRKFWMKNTPAPLDIIFATNGKIVDIKKGNPFSLELIGPDCMVDTVVEVPAGFAQKENIKICDSVLIQYGIKTLSKLISS